MKDPKKIYFMCYLWHLSVAHMWIAQATVYKIRNNRNNMKLKLEVTSTVMKCEFLYLSFVPVS